jgi:hypothetical protein
MTSHFDAGTLAEFRAGLITGRRARKIRAHLDGCASCASVCAQLASVSAVLAAAPSPPMPESVALRLDAALESLISERSVVTPPRRRRVPTGLRLRWPSGQWRVLAPATAVVAVLAGGGGYLLSQSHSSAGVASASSGVANSAASAAHAPAFASRKASIAAPDERTAGIPVFVVTSGANYQPATLSTELSAQLKTLQAQRAGRASAQVAACVNRIAAGQSPTLVESARYDGAPATVIVLAGRAVVAGPACSGTDSDILARAVLSSGISAP